MGERPGRPGSRASQHRAATGAAAGGEWAARVLGAPFGRTGRLASPCPSSAPGPRPETPRRVPETPPGLCPGLSLLPESARGRPRASPRRSLLPGAALTRRVPSPGLGSPAEAGLGRCGAFLFVVSCVTRVGIQSQKRAFSKVALVPAVRA